MLMTAATWQDMDNIMLRLNHIRISIAVYTSLKSSVITTTVIFSNMETTNFLKYVSVVLMDKSQFLNFYDNLVTQAAGFHIFLRLSDEITRVKGVVPDYMDPDVENATVTALYTKFW